MLRSRVFAASLLGFGLGISTAALAEEFPTRPITYIVASAPGGGQDVLARIITERASVLAGQPVVIEYQPGAGGNVAATAAALAEPDGYTVVQLATASAINMSLYDDPGYDLLTDFRPVSYLAVAPVLLVVNASLPAKTFDEFASLVKSRPGEFFYGSSGVGGISHLAFELLKLKAGLDIVHVPYQGAGAAYVDLLANRIQTMVLAESVARPGLDEGALRALAVSTAERSKFLPDLPSLAELGVEGYEAATWYGVVAPAGTPDEVIQKLNEIFAQAARDQAAQIEEQGFEVVASTPEELQGQLERETATWGDVVSQTGAKAEQ